MILAELHDGDSVFVDANIFIYHFGGHSSQCKAFLERCACRELRGYTSTPILAEVLHRLMIAEGTRQAVAVVQNTWATLTLNQETLRWVAEDKELEYDLG